MTPRCPSNRVYLFPPSPRHNPCSPNAPLGACPIGNGLYQPTIFMYYPSYCSTAIQFLQVLNSPILLAHPSIHPPVSKNFRLIKNNFVFLPPTVCGSPCANPTLQRFPVSYSASFMSALLYTVGFSGAGGGVLTVVLV